MGGLLRRRRTALAVARLGRSATRPEPEPAATGQTEVPVRRSNVIDSVRSDRVRTSAREPRRGAIHQLPLDRGTWTPGSELDPAKPLRRQQEQYDYQALPVGETGFEPATARPPAGTMRLPRAGSRGVERLRVGRSWPQLRSLCTPDCTPSEQERDQHPPTQPCSTSAFAHCESEQPVDAADRTSSLAGIRTTSAGTLASRREQQVPFDCACRRAEAF
jgi:hypothetical protein